MTGDASTAQGQRCPSDVPAPSDEKLSLGLMHIANIEFAIPTQYLREAIKPPERLSPLLTSSPHVAGAVDVRGELIPVVNLRHALKLPQAGQVPQDARIVIVRHRSYLFGVMVDMLGGVISIAASQCQSVEVLRPDDPPLIRQVFSLDDGLRVISMLCLDGVIGQLDVPLTRQSEARTSASVEAVTHQWRPYVLFECNGARLALNADVVDTVIELNGAAQSLRPSEGCMGLLQTETRRMAVLDPLAIIGMGQVDTGLNRQVLVLKRGDDRVGLLIRRVVQISRLDDLTRRSVPGMTFARPFFFDGVLPVPACGEFLKLSAQALLETMELSAMASIHGRPQQSAMGHTASGIAASEHAKRAQAYLTFQVGQEFATQLQFVREILPMPEHLTPIGIAGDPRIGMFSHRNEVVPIIDMAVLFGHAPIAVTCDARLLLVDAHEATLALLVERVDAIEQAQWEHPPISQHQWRGAEELDAALHAVTLLTMGEQQPRRGVPALDLPRVARAIESRFAGPMAGEAIRAAETSHDIPPAQPVHAAATQST